MNNLNKRKASILIVEDNELDILVLKVLLERHFNLYIVSNGQDAVNAAREFDFDVVLADINLGDPNMDGVQTMKEIRSNKKNAALKIFAVTAYAENRQHYLDEGFNQVLTKPVIKEEIFDILNETYDSSKFENIDLQKKHN
ncbi:MAG: response regulator [Bacteroidetes bacterium]|nr:response regulator [Bacteroidota bacterium]